MKAPSILIFLGLLGASIGHAAGIDCLKPLSPAERQVGSDPVVAALDGDLAVAYAKTVAAATIYPVRGTDTPETTSPTEIRAQQRAWLHERDKCASPTKACDLSKLYRDRIAELRDQQKDMENCSIGSGPDMASCLSAQYEAVQKELDSLLREIRLKLLDPGRELDAQSAWQEYRDKECHSQVTMNASWGGMEFQQCLRDLTKRRIDELRDHHFCEDNGCPGRK
jgi:uncharacterized protein YecT (DUF1311 family)